ncbi:hypothetical protein DFH09DRAFT_1132570 [Mycena vulgaris]|nr:hypothetical protein DFH09DRAFT_1132570 [Mycena vulgaris]
MELRSVACLYPYAEVLFGLIQILSTIWALRRFGVSTRIVEADFPGFDRNQSRRSKIALFFHSAVTMGCFFAMLNYIWRGGALDSSVDGDFLSLTIFWVAATMSVAGFIFLDGYSSIVVKAALLTNITLFFIVSSRLAHEIVGEEMQCWKMYGFDAYGLSVGPAMFRVQA